jgi:hypothetical protein
VHVIYGSKAGLSAADDQFLTQDTAGIRETADDYEGFGSALAAANFGKGERADLAVGVPNESFSRVTLRAPLARCR